MCLFPKLIRNPTKFLNINGGQPLQMYVPCGHCKECNDKKNLEWKFRSYHEVSDVIKHGYVVYDTLTYADEYLPHISDFVSVDKLSVGDFSCFNCDHWRGFLKRLRRHLEYHYSIVNLRYFLVSEYGMDDNYTHRPHYHVLFFLPTRKLSPVKFSRIVSTLWFYGRTDGIQYNTFADFREKVFGYNFGDGDAQRDILKVCGYISKYITKDSTFEPTLRRRCQSCIDAFDDEDTIKLCKSCINQYHRQSQGFGLSFLNTLDSSSYNKLFHKGIVQVEDEDKVVATLPLPMYYKRKLFYNLHKLDDGSSTWIPNTNGKQFVENTMIRSVDSTYERFYNAFINLPVQTQTLINNLLNKRNLYDLSIYSVLYCNRMLPYHYNSLSSYTQIQEPSDMLRLNVSATYSHLSSDVPCLERDVDCGLVHCPISLDLFGIVSSKAFNYDKFLSSHTITQNTFPHFRHFDDIIDILTVYKNQYNVGKQKLSDYYDLLTKKFNILYGKKC